MSKKFSWPGEFPDCGCKYTIDDDGIHYCRLHHAAPELFWALEGLLLVSLPNDISGQRYIDQARAALAKAKGAQP